MPKTAKSVAIESHLEAAAASASAPGAYLRPVLVTTSRRGVFFGYVDPNWAFSDTIVLMCCRNVLYWGASVKGFLGLAVTGPDRTCRVGPAAPSTQLNGVDSVSDCTPSAVAAFEAQPWSS